MKFGRGMDFEIRRTTTRELLTTFCHCHCTSTTICCYGSR